MSCIPSTDQSDPPCSNCSGHSSLPRPSPSSLRSRRAEVLCPLSVPPRAQRRPCRRRLAPRGRARPWSLRGRSARASVAEPRDRRTSRRPARLRAHRSEATCRSRSLVRRLLAPLTQAARRHDRASLAGVVARCASMDPLLKASRMDSTRLLFDSEKSEERRPHSHRCERARSESRVRHPIR